jgi:hypothetical protein
MAYIKVKERARIAAEAEAAETPAPLEAWGVCDVEGDGCDRDRRLDDSGLIVYHSYYDWQSGQMLYPCPGSGCKPSVGFDSPEEIAEYEAGIFSG